MEAREHSDSDDTKAHACTAFQITTPKRRRKCRFVAAAAAAAAAVAIIQIFMRAETYTHRKSVFT